MARWWSASSPSLPTRAAAIGPASRAAAPPDEGKRLYELFTASLAEHGVTTATGRFGQVMKVHLVNDGPVTIWLDTAG